MKRSGTAVQRRVFRMRTWIRCAGECSIIKDGDEEIPEEINGVGSWVVK